MHPNLPTTQITVCPWQHNADTPPTSTLAKTCALCMRFRNGVANEPRAKEREKSESKTTTNDPSTKEGGESESKTTKYSSYRAQPQHAADHGDDTKNRSVSPDGTMLPTYTVRGRSTSSPGARVGTAGGHGIFSLFVH